MKQLLKSELKALWQIVKFLTPIALTMFGAWVVLNVVGVAFGGGY